MVERVIEFCARNRFLVLFGVAFALCVAVWSMRHVKLDAIPVIHSVLCAIDTGRSEISGLIASAEDPSTTMTGEQSASIAAMAARRISVWPSYLTSCLGLPRRVEAPAASTTAAAFTRANALPGNLRDAHVSDRAGSRACRRSARRERRGFPRL